MAAPIENSPPGIQTMPSGAEPAAGVLFSTVGKKSEPDNEVESSLMTVEGLEPARPEFTIAAERATTAIGGIQRPIRRRSGDCKGLLVLRYRISRGPLRILELHTTAEWIRIAGINLLQLQ